MLEFPGGSKVAEKLLKHESSLLLTYQLTDFSLNAVDDSEPLVKTANSKKTLKHIVAIIIENNLREVREDFVDNCLNFFGGHSSNLLLKLFGSRLRFYFFYKLLIPFHFFHLSNDFMFFKFDGCSAACINIS